MIMHTAQTYHEAVIWLRLAGYNTTTGGNVWRNPEATRYAKLETIVTNEWSIVSLLEKANASLQK